MPVLKNCGSNTKISGGNDGMSIAFDNSVITNCEIDYDDTQQNGWWTQPYANLPQKMWCALSSDGNHLNCYPKSPLTSLAGLTAYIVTLTSTSQGR